MISTFLTPIFREDVECFGEDTCYSLAFGVPAALMGVATVLLVMGKKLYVMKPPEGNIMTKVIGSIYVSVQLDRIDYQSSTITSSKIWARISYSRVTFAVPEYAFK